MRWFGPSKDEVWERFSREIGGEFVPRSFCKQSRVQARVGPWMITLDTISRQQGKYSRATYTRLRAPYVNPDGFRFKIHQASFWSGLGRLLGMRDVAVGDPKFDDAFVLKGNDESKLIELFSDAKLREMVASLPRMRLEVQNDEGWFGPNYPPDADLLDLETHGVVKDLDMLNRFFAFFSALLHRLRAIGAAHQNDPGVRF